MVEPVQISLKETDRYAVIQQVIERTMGQSDAALWLNISVRQVKRLARAIRQWSKPCGWPESAPWKRRTPAAPVFGTAHCPLSPRTSGRRQKLCGIDPIDCSFQ